MVLPWKAGKALCKPRKTGQLSERGHYSIWAGARPDTLGAGENGVETQGTRRPCPPRASSRAQAGNTVKELAGSETVGSGEDYGELEVHVLSKVGGQ